MSGLLLLTTTDCHLCEHGEQVLAQLAAEGPLSWRALDDHSPEGRALAHGAPPLRPVLFDDGGRVLAYGRLSAKRLRKQLARAAA